MRRETQVRIAVIIASFLLAVIWTASRGSAPSEIPPAPAGQLSDPPAIQTDCLLLPEGWCAEHIEKMQVPVELQVPVGERWRFNCPPPFSSSLNAMVWEDFVFLSYSKADPQVNLDEYWERRKAGSTEVLEPLRTTECRDLATGQVLWSTSGGSVGPIVLPGCVPLFSAKELVVLELAQGRMVRRLPLRLRARDTEKFIKPKQGQDFVEAWALDVRHNLLDSVLSGRDPVPLDITRWTAADYRRLRDIFSWGDSRYLLQHGATSGRFFFPNPDDVVFASIVNNLTYRSVTEDRVHWRQVCTPGSSCPLLWQPPYIVIFSSATAVTAYRIADGSSAWMYEFPADRSNRGPVHRIASLTDGILLITEPLLGLTGAERACLTVAEQQEHYRRRSPYLWLTKLDHEGHRLFQQELTMKSLHQRFTISNGFLVLWTHDGLVCYGPTTEVPRSVPPDTDPPLDEEQGCRKIEELHTEYANVGQGIASRLGICAKLGALRDRSMLDVVLKDLAEAGNDAKALYVAMVGCLDDRRAIDALIPLLKDESWSIRTAADDAMHRLTGVDLPLTEWEPWWQVHRHLFSRGDNSGL